MPEENKNFSFIKNIISRHGQRLMNIYLFASFTAWCVFQTFKTYREGRLDYIEISFAVQNIIMVSLFLVRKNHRAINTNIFDQCIALIAFCSGAAFIGQPVSGGTTIGIIAVTVIIAANILGAVTLINLGRSFGILIALREVKTSGLYSVVRHPMYFTDILLRVGYVIYHFNLFTVSVFTASTLCYLYRALLEEKFLSQDPSYAEYMKNVRYRFIPGVF